MIKKAYQKSGIRKIIRHNVRKLYNRAFEEEEITIVVKNLLKLGKLTNILTIRLYNKIFPNMKMAKFSKV